MANKKITIFSLTMEVGGIEKFVASLANVLSINNNVEIVCTYKPQGKMAFDISNKVHIKYLLDEKIDYISLKKLIKNFKFLSAIKEIIRRNKIERKAYELNRREVAHSTADIIITTRVFHNRIVSRFKNEKVKTIATEHNSLLNNKKYTDSVIESVKNIDILLVGSDELFNYYNDKILETNCKKMPYSIDSISNKKTKFNTKNIVSVGRFSEEKGFLDLIDVMSIIVKKDDSIKLFLIGDGYEMAVIKNKVKTLNLENNVILTGFKSQDDIKNYFLNSSLFVMTSKYEAFGLVLIEAMSYGIPCISFDTGTGPREIINSDIGCLIINRDKNKMAAEIIKLLYNKNKLKKYQSNINSIIGDYSLENFSDYWNEIIK